ncbi:muscle M-line assembly protein unc-89-like [Ylistrum balloti]|uniref:muscle M-line assembly protein unc-89-like n=1 Tax=Ylistrum balloti TaxID=509963 RepID=UPI0029058F83|nr:muscle M-line assembly protein unc-89-like [Ylistrum balloti]
MMHLYFLIIQPKADNTLSGQNEACNAGGNRKTEEVAMCRTLCDQVKNFLSMCHLRHSTIKKPEAPVYPYSYWDLLSSNLAMFVDLYLLTNKMSHKQEQVSRRLCNIACYLTEDNPSFRLDTFIQMSNVHTSTNLLLPFIRRAFEKKPGTGDFQHYLKYVLALRTVSDTTEDKEENSEVDSLRRQACKTVPAPKHFLDWLRNKNEDILDEMPVEDRHFKGSSVTRFILEEADDQLLSWLTDTLTQFDGENDLEEQDKKEKKKSKKKKRKLESSKMVDEESTPDAELFFLDTGGSKQNQSTELENKVSKKKEISLKKKRKGLKEAMDQESTPDSGLFFLDTGGSKQVLEAELEDPVPKKKLKKKIKDSQKVQDEEAEDPIPKKKKKEIQGKTGLESKQDSQLFFLDTAGSKPKQVQDNSQEPGAEMEDQVSGKKEHESLEATTKPGENEETEVYIIDTTQICQATTKPGENEETEVYIIDTTQICQDKVIEDEESDDSLEITQVTFSKNPVESSDEEEIEADELDIKDMEEDISDLEIEADELDIKDMEEDISDLEIEADESDKRDMQEDESDMEFQNNNNDKENKEEEVKNVIKENQVNGVKLDAAITAAKENVTGVISDTGKDVWDKQEKILSVDENDFMKGEEMNNESDKVIVEVDDSDKVIVEDNNGDIDMKTDQERTEEMLACFVDKSPREVQEEDLEEGEVTLTTPNQKRMKSPELPVSGRSTRQKKNFLDTSERSRSSEGQEITTKTLTTDIKEPSHQNTSGQSHQTEGKKETQFSKRTRSSNLSPEKESFVSTPRRTSPGKRLSVISTGKNLPRKRSEICLTRKSPPEERASISSSKKKSTEKQIPSSVRTSENTSTKKCLSVATPATAAPQKRLFEDAIGLNEEEDKEENVCSPRVREKAGIYRKTRGTTSENRTESRTPSQKKEKAEATTNAKHKKDTNEFNSDEEVVKKILEKRQKTETDRLKTPKSTKPRTPKNELSLLKTPKTESTETDRLKTPKSIKPKTPKNELTMLKTPKTESNNLQAPNPECNGFDSHKTGSNVCKTPRMESNRLKTPGSESQKTPKSIKKVNKTPISVEQSQSPRKQSMNVEWPDFSSDDKIMLPTRRSSRTPKALPTQEHIDTPRPGRKVKTPPQTTPEKSLKSQNSPVSVQGGTSRRRSVPNNSADTSMVSADTTVSELTAANPGTSEHSEKRYSLRVTRKRKELENSNVGNSPMVTRLRKSVSGNVDSAVDSQESQPQTGNTDVSFVSSSGNKSQSHSKLQTINEDSNLVMDRDTDSEVSFSIKVTQTQSSRRKSTTSSSIKTPFKSDRRYSLRGKD